MSLLPLAFSLSKTAVVLLAVGAVACYDLSERSSGKQVHYLFAVILGSILSLGLIRSTEFLFLPSFAENGSVAAALVVFLFFTWRSLFGPWKVRTKVAVLGTFLFWVGLHMYFQKESAEQTAQILGMIIGLLPAGIWVLVFLRCHEAPWAHVVLMFFAGMLSTVPILFYDLLVRRGIELEFFLFKVVPQSFSSATHNFVFGQLPGISGVRSTILATFLSFLIVGLIEELSKFWVLKKASDKVFTSIGDVLELSIIVAIGFAFAENVAGSGYFIQFVREYLVGPNGPDIVGFASNVLGRSVLTTMVHVVSTGVMGYFFAMAIYATPYLEEEQRAGKTFPVIKTLSKLLRIPWEKVFRIQMMITGIFAAVLLHGFFNFIVTVPDLLPGQPRTIGDLLGSPAGSLFHNIAILLIPSFLYVVGGFWLLSGLFLRKTNMKERGYRQMKEVFVKAPAAA